MEDDLQVEDQVENRVENPVENQVKDQVESHEENSVKDQVESHEENSVEDQVESQVESLVENQVENTGIKNDPWFKKYGHSLLFLWYPVCVLIYTLINQYRTPILSVYSVIDDFIPFNEIFVIPYTIWYAYLAFGFIIFFLKSKKEFYRFCIYTYVGMAVAYIFYFFVPNCIDFRPDLSELGRSNILLQILDLLYRLDVNPNNVFPSLHCFNALVISVCLSKSRLFDDKKWLTFGSWVLTILICFSTAFVKQHSILDFLGAILLTVMIYPLAYKINWKFMKKLE